MHRTESVTSRLYKILFPYPVKGRDPNSWAQHVRKNLVPEVQMEVQLFYGDPPNPADDNAGEYTEIHFPGLDYSYNAHRMRLRRFTWHRRLFRAMDTLGLTEYEVYALCDWEGTLKTRHEYEARTGTVVVDTTAAEVPTVAEWEAEVEALTLRRAMERFRRLRCEVQGTPTPRPRSFHQSNRVQHGGEQGAEQIDFSENQGHTLWHQHRSEVLQSSSLYSEYNAPPAYTEEFPPVSELSHEDLVELAAVERAASARAHRRILEHLNIPGAVQPLTPEALQQVRMTSSFLGGATSRATNGTQNLPPLVAISGTTTSVGSSAIPLPLQTRDQVRLATSVHSHGQSPGPTTSTDRRAMAAA